MAAALACGLATVDVVQVVDAVPGADEKVVARSVAVSAGGPACRAAMVAALLGVGTRFVGAVGRTPLSTVVLEGLGAHGVEVVDVAPPAFVPPLSTVLVTASTGERAVVSRNAAGVTGYEPVPASRARDLLEGVGAVLVDGHHLPVALAVARAARERGVVVLLDGGSWKPGLEELIRVVDVAVVSADFRAPAGDALEDLLALGPAWVARSAGAGPVVWHAGDGSSGEVPVPEVDVVDTLGAGDVLHGALLAQLAAGGVDDLVGSLTRAVAVASRSVTAPGALGWADDR